MPTAIVFDLATALVTTFRAAVPPSVNVYDGQGASDDPGFFLMVGVDDPDSDDEVDSAAGTLEWAGLGHKASKEAGEVSCCAVAWVGESGSSAQQAAREAVRDIMTAVEATLRADPNLGGLVPGLNWVRYAGEFSLRQRSDSQGVRAVFSFRISYIASL